jgi:hypothetical protein
MAQEEGDRQGKVAGKTEVFIGVKGVSGRERAENQTFVPDRGMETIICLRTARKISIF